MRGLSLVVCFCQILKVKLEQSLQWLLKQIHHPKMLATGLLLRNYKAVLEYLAVLQIYGPWYIIIENHTYFPLF